MGCEARGIRCDCPVTDEICAGRLIQATDERAKAKGKTLRDQGPGIGRLPKQPRADAGWGIWCHLVFRTRLSEGDFVGGEGDGAQENRDGTGMALEPKQIEP
jgi:hypothetical protein